MTSKNLTDAIEFASRHSIAADSLASELSRLNERLVPPWIRSMQAINERFERLADPLGLRKLNDSVLGRSGTAFDSPISKLMGSNVFRAAGLHSELARAAGIYEQPEWMKVSRQFAEMMGPTQ